MCLFTNLYLFIYLFYLFNNNNSYYYIQTKPPKPIANFIKHFVLKTDRLTEHLPSPITAFIVPQQQDEGKSIEIFFPQKDRGTEGQTDRRTDRVNEAPSRSLKILTQFRQLCITVFSQANFAI